MARRITWARHAELNAERLFVRGATAPEVARGPRDGPHEHLGGRPSLSGDARSAESVVGPFELRRRPLGRGPLAATFEVAAIVMPSLTVPSTARGWLW